MIDRFHGPYYFLSNFFPCDITGGDGEVYRSVEHAYQAAKFSDPTWRKVIRSVLHAGRAKRLGQHPVGCDPDWAKKRVAIMRSLLEQKFAVGSTLGRFLLDTGEEELVEGNTWNDTFWGKCNGVGENNLGKLLMQRRSELRRVGSNTSNTTSPSGE